MIPRQPTPLRTVWVRATMLAVGLLALLLAIGAFANETLVRGRDDRCVNDRLLALFVKHQFAEAEAEFRVMLAKAIDSGDVRLRICARHFLAGAQKKQEKFNEALSNYRATVEDAKTNLPADDDQLLAAQEMLASTLGTAGDRASEIRTYSELLPIYEHKYGKQSEKVATLLRSLSTAHAWVGNWPYVVKLDRQTLNIVTNLSKTSVGDRWRKYKIPNLAKAQMHLAEALTHVPDGSNEALRLSEHGIPAMKAMLGNVHPDVLNAELVHATAIRKTGNLQDAIALERNILQTARLNLGDLHPISRKAATNLAVSLEADGSISNAADMEHELLKSLASKHGTTHPETIFAATNYSITLTKAKRYDEAIPVAEDALRSMLTVRRTLDFDSRLVAAWQGEFRRLMETYLLSLSKSKRHSDAFLSAEFFKSRMLADRLALDVNEFRLPEGQRKHYRSTIRDLTRIEQELALRRTLNQQTIALADLEASRQRAAEAVKLAGSAQNNRNQTELLPTAKTPPSWIRFAQALSEENTAYVSFVRFSGWIHAFSFSQDGRGIYIPIAPAEELRSLVAATRHLMEPANLRQNNKKKVWKSQSGKYRIAETRQDSESEIRKSDALLEEISNRLFKQLEPALSGRQAIVISPDDALAHVPFAVLPYKGKPLVETLQIAMVPSLETLQSIRTKAKQTANLRLRPVLAFGGARYQRIERYSKHLYVRHEKPTATLMDIKIIRQTMGNDPKKLPLALASFSIGMANLPGSEDEAKQIAHGYGGLKAGARALTGESATEAAWNRLTDSSELADYRVIHFAAHGFLSDDDPALSAIVLGQVQREPGTDGYLTAAELSSVNLNSDLVVVSACNSGVSGFVEGEGMMGIAQALFEAGTRHSLLTLWPIGDKPTAKFMEKFYERYRSGESAPRALASAQRWAIQKGWGAHDWAAFVLHGY